MRRSRYLDGDDNLRSIRRHSVESGLPANRVYGILVIRRGKIHGP